jgi:hypothetical protein
MPAWNSSVGTWAPLVKWLAVHVPPEADGRGPRESTERRRRQVRGGTRTDVADPGVRPESLSGGGSPRLLDVGQAGPGTSWLCRVATGVVG